MPHEFEWEKQIAWSSGVTEKTHPDTIKKLLGDSCERVEKEDAKGNDQGIDFRAFLRRGAELLIDIKARDLGCSRYWKACPLTHVGIEPELALETWSVVPVNGQSGQVGWTLDEAKRTHYTLHVFDPSDTPEAFLLPFQLLRAAFRRNRSLWAEKYRTEQQQTHRRNGGCSWRSECIFVPAVLVLEAISKEMRPTAKNAKLPEQQTFTELKASDFKW